MRYFIFAFRPDLSWCESSPVAVDGVLANLAQDQIADPHNRNAIPRFESTMILPAHGKMHELRVVSPFAIDAALRAALVLQREHSQALQAFTGGVDDSRLSLAATPERPTFFRDWLNRLGPYLAQGYSLEGRELAEAIVAHVPDLRVVWEYLHENYVVVSGSYAMGAWWSSSRTVGIL